VGLCTAWEAARRGASVAVIDGGAAGGATSLANTGWVVPALSAPVAAPGSVKQGMQMTFRRDNPFYIKPRPSIELARWLMAFQRSSQPERFRAGADAILALNQHTLGLFDGMRDAGVQFEMHGGGLIFLCLGEGPLAGAAARFDALGYDGEIERVEGAALRRLEPAVSDAVHGGLHIKPERVVRPETLTNGLVDALKKMGAPVIEHSPVSDVARAGGAWRVSSKTAQVEADNVVLAAGIWTNKLARSFGLRLPMQPGKGYSLTATGDGTPPARALFFVEAMIGAAPYDSAVRLAGMLELRGDDPKVRPRRIELLVRAAQTYLKGWQPERRELEWAGLRPLPPDGLPIVGQVPGHDGLFLATGHGMVGLTLAPVTGHLLAPLVLEGKLAPELKPLRVGRF
jgi:D-amino-acid dehydrogenase